MKTFSLSVLLLAAGSFASSAWAQGIDFAGPGASVPITALIYKDGSQTTNYVTGTNPIVLEDESSAMFEGLMDGVTFWMNLHDKDALGGVQTAFLFNNTSGAAVTYAPGDFQIGFQGLYALGGGELLPEFTISDASSWGELFAQLTPTYDSGSGTFSFTNLAEFTIPTGFGTAFGDFSVAAIPEPSVCALAAGVIGLGVVAWRRRRV